MVEFMRNEKIRKIGDISIRLRKIFVFIKYYDNYISIIINS